MLLEMQHRIEALELEKQLLRAKNRGPGDEDDLSDVPLEAYIHSFKVKYARQQQVFDERVKNLDARVREMENDNTVLLQQVQRLTSDKAETEANFQQSEQQRVAQRDEYGQRELQLASKLEKITAILAAKDKQHQAHVELSGQETRKLRTLVTKLQDDGLAKERKINDQTEQLEKYETATQAMTTRNVELSHELDLKLTTIRTYDQEVRLFCAQRLSASGCFLLSHTPQFV